MSRDGRTATRLEEAVRARFDLIHAYNDALRAVILPLEEAALSALADLARMDERLPLLGRTFAVKDNIDVCGAVTTNGRAEPPGEPAHQDSAVVQRLRLAGAVPVAKTNLAELCLGATTQNRRWGGCANPWNLTRIPGGSSGGSAVAVAAGMCDFALGTDTGGSVRNPAAFCGVVGLRPTPGRVPLHGVTPVSRTFDVVGPMARTAVEIAEIQAILEHRSLPSLNSHTLHGLRVGVPTSFFYDDLHSAVAASADHVQQVVVAAGATLHELRLTGSETTQTTFNTLIHSHAAHEHRTELTGSPETFDPEVRERLLIGLRTSDHELQLAERYRRLWSRQIIEAFERVDVLLLPTVPEPAPPRRTGNMIETTQRVNRLNCAWSLAELPSISVPSGFSTEGLPVGVQFVGAPHTDWRLIEIAVAYQARTDWHRQRPPLPSPGRRPA